MYGKLANLTSWKKRLQARNVTDTTGLVDELNALRRNLEEWRRDLPPYYEPQDVPVTAQRVGDDELDVFADYPYETFHSYVVGIVNCSQTSSDV